MRQTNILHYAGLLGAAVLALSSAGCGSSAPGMRDGVDGAFIRAAATWDLNHDGNVTCDEWRQYVASAFKDADLNRDGKLSQQEFDRLAKMDRLFLIANFAYYDSDRKGYVTLEDFTGKPNPAFEQLDKDHTCVIKTYQLRAAITDDPAADNPGSHTNTGAVGPQRH